MGRKYGKSGICQFRLGIRKKFILRKSGVALEQTVQGGGRIIVSRGVQVDVALGTWSIAVTGMG